MTDNKDLLKLLIRKSVNYRKILVWSVLKLKQGFRRCQSNY